MRQDTNKIEAFCCSDSSRDACDGEGQQQRDNNGYLKCGLGY
jgi:hypothetical protein